MMTKDIHTMSDFVCFDTVHYELTDLDKAWADIYWTFQENAFDLSDNHIGRYTAPVPFSNDKYFEIYAEVPF